MSYTHDDLAPAAPSGLDFAGGATANDNNPVLVGTAEPGSRVRVFLDAGNLRLRLSLRWKVYGDRYHLTENQLHRYRTTGHF